jgi:3-hydroxymyristoyl/3-hydroxydecanoyl-(acyl carrier protein) dehydratase
MPGTLMLEAIAQTAVALMANQPVVYGQTPHYLTSAITNFRSRITSDDRELKIVVTPTLHRLGVSKFSGEAKVGSRICVQATLTYFTPDKGVSPAAVQGFVMTDLPK